MKKFLDFLKEEISHDKGLHVFDVDDTLFHTTAKIRVMKGKKQVAALSNSEYNTHTLPKGHTYDYSEFRSAEKFDYPNLIDDQLAFYKDMCYPEGNGLYELPVRFPSLINIRGIKPIVWVVICAYYYNLLVLHLFHRL